MFENSSSILICCLTHLLDAEVIKTLCCSLFSLLFTIFLLLLFLFKKRKSLLHLLPKENTLPFLPTVSSCPSPLSIDCTAFSVKKLKKSGHFHFVFWLFLIPGNSCTNGKWVKTEENISTKPKRWMKTEVEHSTCLRVLCPTDLSYLNPGTLMFPSLTEDRLTSYFIEKSRK